MRPNTYENLLMRGAPCLHMCVCGWLSYVSANGKVAHLRTYLLSKMKLYGACP